MPSTSTSLQQACTTVETLFATPEAAALKTDALEDLRKHLLECLMLRQGRHGSFVVHFMAGTGAKKAVTDMTALLTDVGTPAADALAATLAAVLTQAEIPEAGL